MTKQVKYREVKGSNKGPWKLLAKNSDGLLQIPTWNMSATVDFIEIEERQEFEIGDTFQSGSWLVTIVGQRTNRSPGGAETATYECEWVDDDGETFYDFSSGPGLLGMGRLNA